MKNKKLIISVDFDQTIAKVPHFPRIDGLRKGAKKYINKLYDEGHYIIINTCRTDNYENEIFHATEAMMFLDECEIKYHQFNNNHPELIKHFKTDCLKTSADIYIDDKGMWLFRIPNWFWLYWIVQWKNLFIKKRLLNLVK